MKQIKDNAFLEETADRYVCALCNKTIKRAKKEFNSIKDDYFKSLVIRKFNKRMQFMSTTIYAATPNIEIRIGG